MGHEELFRNSVMLRTYSRVVEGEGRKERPDEVYNRVLDSFEKYYISKYPWLKDYYHRDLWFEMMSNGRALPAGRMLWSMGSRTIEKEGFLPMMNCSFVAVDHPISPVLFALKMLILGCGVGFSLERKYFKNVELHWQIRRRYNPTIELRHVSNKYHNEDVHIIRDSKEGWIRFFEVLMTRAIEGHSLVFSTCHLRPAGSPIKGFGGISGDPQKLIDIAKKIWSGICESGSRPSVTLYYDIMCWIAELVISGNVRRSALIAIGDPDDKEYLKLKRFDMISRLDAKQRYFCNNSVNIEKWSDLGEDYWDTYIPGRGEPYGWVNVKKAAERDECFDVRYPPQGFNPCGEQPLHSKEMCCLSEVNLEKINEKYQLILALTMTYLFCKMSYTLGCPTEKETERICQSNQRIGISFTGISMVEREKFTEYAIFGRWFLKELDRKISSLLGCPLSVALTTVKPGGTLPKIAGSSGPGIHLPISEYQIRRVRFSKRCALLPFFKELGMEIEDDLSSPDDTSVVSFYLRNRVPASGLFSNYQLVEDGLDMMLERISLAQKIWSDNSVSVTLYYNPEMSMDVFQKMIKRYSFDLKCFSALPYYGHNFKQAPEEPITKEQYLKGVEGFDFAKSIEIPLDLDGIIDPEDFGTCRIDGVCSDR